MIRVIWAAMLILGSVNVMAEDLQVTLETTKGNIVLKLYPDKTPLTVANYVNLIQRGFYNGVKFHRVIPDFMVQTGDPEGTGYGGPGYKFQDEFDPSLKHDGPGVLSMANAGPGSNGSQFFITHVATPWLNGKHTIFGQVVSGQDVVNKIEQGDRIIKASLSGSADGVLKAKADQIASWNKVLDQKYPAKAG